MKNKILYHSIGSVILSNAKNLDTCTADANRSFAPLRMTRMGAWMTMTMAALALAFAGCSEEELMQPANGQTGTLHISSVIIDGQQVGRRSRVVAENDSTYNINELPANHSITGFSEGDEIQLSYSFEPVSWELADDCAAKARFDGSSWTITDDEDYNGDDVINPDFDYDEKWKDVKMYASVAPASAGPMSLGRQAEGSNTTPQYVLGDLDEDDVWQVTDCLYASTEDGSITVDTDLNSPTLGATTIRFKHQDALLRLPIPESGFNVAGTYVVDGTAYNVTGLATLWAFLDGNCYVPFTQVGNNLQAIVYSGVSLVGFKAVLYATEVAAENTPMPSSTGSEPSTITIDLPFKVGGSASTGIVLEENTQYPLTLNISPNQAVVNLASATGKPGWAVSEDDEEVLTNDNYLTYNAADQYFEVNALAGLQLLSKWMTDEITTAQLKAYNFVGCSSIPTEAAALSANVRLMQDIELTAPEEDASNWTAIGTSGTPYTGTFDGNGHTITGMVINATTGGQGFVGYLGTNGKIKNLTFEDAQVVSTDRWVGIVAGFIDGASVENCYTSEGSSISGAQYVGGIVGGATNSKIAGCINAASVANTGGGDTAGVVGNTDNSIVILCGNTGEVSATGCSVGGIVGYYDNGSQNIASWTISTTEKNGHDGNDVSSKDGIGEDAGNITACYSVASKSALNSKLDKMNEALWQYYKDNSASTGLFWKETIDNWPTTVQQEVSGNSNPYMVDLKYIRSTDLKGTFEVGNAKGLMLLNKWMIENMNTTDFKNLKFDGWQNVPDNIYSRLNHNITLVADITLPTVGEGESNWASLIRRSNNSGYTGLFDGNGYTIENLTICESGYAYVGLVGRLEGSSDRGRVRNLTLENVKITGNGNVGGIVGEMQGASRVENCTVSGVITSKGSAGGIVAWAHGSNLLIYGCTNHAAINVNFTSDSTCPVGGIVGNLSSSANCVSCGNTGVITLDGRINYICVGGIVGLSDTAKLIGCWSIDNVEKESYTNSYAEGANKDGFGAYYDSTITGCYTAAARTEGTTEQKYINDNVDAMNSNISNFVLSNYVTTINYYWVADANGGWPTLTTEAPASPEQGN